jgi:hypothetical protein
MRHTVEQELSGWQEHLTGADERLAATMEQAGKTSFGRCACSSPLRLCRHACKNNFHLRASAARGYKTRKRSHAQRRRMARCSRVPGARWAAILRWPCKILTLVNPCGSCPPRRVVRGKTSADSLKHRARRRAPCGKRARENKRESDQLQCQITEAYFCRFLWRSMIPVSRSAYTCGIPRW